MTSLLFFPEEGHGILKMRKNNFTRLEVAALIQYVRDNQKNLLGKAGHCANKVEERKRRIWKGAVEALRLTGGPPRDWKEIKKKWHGLKCHALAYRKNKERACEGERPRPPYNRIHEEVLETLTMHTTDGTAESDSEDGSLSIHSRQSPVSMDLNVPVERNNVGAEFAGIGASGSRPSPSSEMDGGAIAEMKYSAPHPRRVPEPESVDFFTVLLHQQVELLEKISDKMDTVIELLRDRSGTSTATSNQN